jgi:hypothetical protein
MRFLIITQVPLFVKKNVENKFCPLRACCIIVKRMPSFLRIVKRGAEGWRMKNLRTCGTAAEGREGKIPGVPRTGRRAWTASVY